MNLAEHYKEVNAKTAGRLKSHQLLIERAMLLCTQVSEGVVPLAQNRVKIQNILSQLQLALNISQKEAQNLHKVFAILWDAVDQEDDTAVFFVRDVLETHLVTMKKLQGLENV